MNSLYKAFYIRDPIGNTAAPSNLALSSIPWLRRLKYSNAADKFEIVISTNAEHTFDINIL